MHVYGDLRCTLDLFKNEISPFWQVLHTTRVCNFSEADGLKAGYDAGAELKASARPGFFMW